MLILLALLWMLVVGAWMLFSASVSASVPSSQLPPLPHVKICLPGSRFFVPLTDSSLLSPESWHALCALSPVGRAWRLTKIKEQLRSEAVVPRQESGFYRRIF